MPVWMPLLYPKFWPELWNNAGRFYTAPYCASHVILLRHRTPSHSYGIVTGMFWECFRNPIYMHLCHIFFVFIYSEIFLTLSSSSLANGWLVENWRCNMYYLGLTHLIAGSALSCNPTIAYQLPVYWQDVVSTSEVRSQSKLGQGHEYAIF